jgi:dTDP-4-amino-4,6-dideoxygalactose transaminase
MIQPIFPLITLADRATMSAAAGMGEINNGPWTRKLEEAIGNYHKCDCVCVSSGTSALEIILRYIGHCSYTVPYCSHISTAASALTAGAARLECSSEPFIDADLNGRLARCGEVGDACQSPFTPGLLDERRAVALSFGALKSITGGTGGAIISNDHGLIHFSREYKSYGRFAGGLDCDIIRIGSNHKMSDINAALAFSQWSRREEIIADRWRLYHAYKGLLGDRILPRSNLEVPWLIDCNVSAEFAASGTFRAHHPQYGHYKCLRDYITNWRDAMAPATVVYLPSYFNMQQADIEKYACMIMEDDKC